MAHGDPVRYGLRLTARPWQIAREITRKEKTVNTITEKQTDTLTITAEALRELLGGAATHAHASDDLPSLNAVKLWTDSGKLYAVATDRYRLIEGSVESDGSLSETLLRLADIKRIQALIKEKRLDRMPVTLSRVGDLVSVAIAGDSLTAQAWEANYPPHAHLMPAGEEIAVGGISFNPSFFADYAKIEKLAGAKKSAGVRVSFYGEKKPIGVHVNGDKVAWRALLMPMRTV
jgi:DNA polymerase III sliding clamp (beta) subunit (PCNA family)